MLSSGCCWPALSLHAMPSGVCRSGLARLSYLTNINEWFPAQSQTGLKGCVFHLIAAQMSIFPYSPRFTISDRRNVLNRSFCSRRSRLTRKRHKEELNYFYCALFTGSRRKASRIQRICSEVAPCYGLKWLIIIQVFLHCDTIRPEWNLNAVIKIN